jgi:ribosomal protein L6P/L9E
MKDKEAFLKFNNPRIRLVDEFITVDGYKYKKLFNSNLKISQKEGGFSITYKDNCRGSSLVNTWFSLLENLNKGLEEPYRIALKKVFRKKFNFYHELKDKKVIITYFEKQRKPIVIDYTQEYFKPLDILIEGEDIIFSSYSNEVLGNGVSKLLKLRKRKLLKKDLRKFITGYAEKE